MQMGFSFVQGDLALSYKRATKTQEGYRSGAGGRSDWLSLFNAPIGGSVFVFSKSWACSNFTPCGCWWLTLAAATVAVWIMRLMLGSNALVFTVPTRQPNPGLERLRRFSLSVLCWEVRARYQQRRQRLGLLRLSDRLSGVSSVSRAAIIGAAVGLVAWIPCCRLWRREPHQAILADRFCSREPCGCISRAFSPGSLVFCRVPPEYSLPRYWCRAAPLGRSSPRACWVLHSYARSLARPSPWRWLGWRHVVSGQRAVLPLTGIIVLTVRGNDRARRSDPGLARSASLVAMVVAMLLKSEPIYVTLIRRMKERAAMAEPRTVDGPSTDFAR